VIAAQGRERLDEFANVASGRAPAETRPAELPESVQRVLNLFAVSLDVLSSGDSSRTLTRMRLVELGEMLKTIRREKDESFSRSGEHLLELVDKQNFHASISWEEFVMSAQSLIVDTRAKYLEAVEGYRWKPQAKIKEESGTDENA
jgi:hypothetical protein